MDEAILGHLRSGEDLGQDRVMIPIKNTPRSRGRYIDAFSVRLPTMSKDEELAPIGAAPNQVLDRSHLTSSAWQQVSFFR